MSTKHAFTLRRGETFSVPVRWASGPIVYKPISAITNTAPVSITATAHGLPDGWPVAVVSVLGMKEINALSSPPAPADYTPATVVNANTVELNSINAARYKPYTSGGYLQYQSPVNLSGYTARMAIKDKLGGTTLLTLTSENGGIVLDNTAKTITLLIDAAATAALPWKKAVFDLELVSGDVVECLLSGTITVTDEVTT